MKIKKLETFTKPYVSFVKTTLEDGSEGFGQMSTYHADISAQIFHKQVAPWVLGQSWMDFNDIENLVLEKEHKFPGSYLLRAIAGLEEFKKHLDKVIVVPNQNLFKLASETPTFEESFNLSNNVLKHGVQSVTDLMVRPGMINLDFADVETVMSSMGKAIMGTSEADGENRATVATEMALDKPLIDEYSLQGARGLLINITGGKDLT